MDKKKVFLLAALAVLIGLFFIFDLGRFLTLEALKANRDDLFASYAANRAAFILSFIAVYIVTTGLSLPGGAILTLGGGAVFGALVGTGAVLVGATIGATAAFLLARYLFREAIEARFGANLQIFNHGLKEGATGYLLFLRLVPLFPFFLINLGAGLTQVPLRTYFITTAIGILPGTFVFANAGANLARINQLSDVASPGVLGAFALLGLFALLPTIILKVRGKKNAAASPDTEAQAGD
ncbi:MAG: TVP38/TMEM64 family protein [Leptospirillia bacterium]